MKVKTKEVVQKQTVYVSEDGREFDSQEVCETYEKAVKEEKMYSIAESLPHFQFAPPTPDMETEYIWTYCNNRHELEAVMAKYLCEEERNNYYDSDLDKIPLPGWVLTASDDGGYGFISGADRELEAFEKFVAEVRKLMENGGSEL